MEKGLGNMKTLNAEQLIALYEHMFVSRLCVKEHRDRFYNLQRPFGTM